jgi:hypothetical protein
MTARYEGLGISFLYPENWRIVDEQADEWPHGVSVESPDGGYWQIQLYPSRMDLARLSEQALEAMQGEYEGLEWQAVTEELFDVTASGYDLYFFCLDFLVTSRIRSLYMGDQTILLICQAESREFDRLRLVFDAITKSLLGD